MANLKEVKERINSVSSTQQITKAMKMVAAAKLRRAQDKIVQMRPYSQKLTAILNNISSGSEGSTDIVYAQQRTVEKVLFVPITSDKGLCGAFNSNVIKAASLELETTYAGKQITVMPIGKKAFDHFKKRSYPIIDDYALLFADVSFDRVKVAAEHVMNAFELGLFDKVVLVYNEFKNVATQVVKAEQFLPIEQNEVVDAAASQQDYIVEPSRDYIIEELVPNSLKIQFYKAILDSNASEHGARMTAMDKATENANDLLKQLKLVYNRTRQAAITNEILEIVAGAEALESSD
ncbi:MAG: ATP synthase F1 subunit gamma [Lunatimonas sp.]|uniref:ATP synthase F1 subunit gamma n=1 Tax=Lunatimonas sp. TaxID=2060141 RepID=UPI00263AD6CD|nr:ATP synthase F1 subunit gamma [Lunatimonas sp.]MCC5937726.1 ATP synthase F1 subunit gamma [Lunatimonas sp.]